VAAAISTSHVRRAQIVSLSLTELMLLLVFMAIAFSFLAKKEGLHEVPRLQAQLNDALNENQRLARENVGLRTRLSQVAKERDSLKRFLSELKIDAGVLASPHGPIKIGNTWYVPAKTGGQAPGRPMCKLVNTFLLNLSLLPGMRIEGAPNYAADSVAAAIPGIDKLASGQPLSLAEFGAAARALSASTKNDCVYAVRATRLTNDANAFDAELTAIGQFFYVSRHK
jgi:hypothetical protein